MTNVAISPIFKMRLSLESKLAYPFDHWWHFVECCIHWITSKNLNSCNPCGQVDCYFVHTAHCLQTYASPVRLENNARTEHNYEILRIAAFTKHHTFKASATRLEQPSQVIPSTFSSSSIRSAATWYCSMLQTAMWKRLWRLESDKNTFSFCRVHRGASAYRDLP